MPVDPKKMKKDLEELNKLYKELKRESVGMGDFSQGAKGAEQLKIYLREARNEVSELNTSFADTVDFINNIGKEFNKGFNNPLKEGTRSFKILRGLASDLEDDMLGIVDLEKKQLLSIKKKTKQEQQSHIRIIKNLKEKEKTQEGINEEEQALLDNLESEVDATKIILDQTEKRLQQEEKIAKTAGITGAIFNSLSKTLGKVGIGSEFFEDGKKNIREAAKSGSKLKVVGAGISSVFSGIGQALGDPVAMFGLLTKAFTSLLALGQKFSKYTADIGKSFLGMDAGAANVAKNLKKMATGVNGVYLNFEEAKKALIGINAVAGTAINVSEKQVLQYQKYSHFLGLSEEATQGLLKTSTLAGSSFEEIGAEITGVVDGLNQSSKLSLNVNDVLESVAGASATMRANIGQSPKSLAKAAFEAKKLGMSMDQIAAAGESSLDFQSSIEKEMAAELLLGKNLNLEALRSASLRGDEITVAKEMNRLLSENYDSTKGNKIQQKALADTLGVSVEEMHAMNQTRLLQNKLSAFGAEDRIKAEKEVNRLVAKGISQEDALKQIADGKLEASVKAGETAEESQRILEQAKETLMNGLAPIAKQVAEAVSEIASSDSFKSFLKTMGDIMGWIAKHPKLVMAAVGLKMISSLIPKPVYLVGKGGKMIGDIGNMFKKKPDALAKASQKFSPKQIAAGFGGKAAKDQLAKKGGAVGLKSIAKKTGTKSVAKVGAKLGAKAIGKSILKKIPGVGLLAGIGFGLQRAMKGDFAGAALELASGAVSLVPGFGTAASVAIDAGLAAKDIASASSGGETAADFISRPGQPIQKFRKDDIIVGGTSLGGGGNNGEVIALLKELVSAVKEGGDVFIDGNKVGKSLALATSNMG
jgi:hypothetical protein